MRYVLELNIYFLPFFPNLGNYIGSVIGVLYPAIVYAMIYTSLKTYDRDNKYIVKVGRRFVVYPLMTILIFIIFLTSGLGKYKMIAIGSGSMEPIYYRGDAVIYEKRKDFANFEIGNILDRFKSNPKLELLFVMIVVPSLTSCFQYWVTDNFLKESDESRIERLSRGKEKLPGIGPEYFLNNNDNENNKEENFI